MRRPALQPLVWVVTAALLYWAGVPGISATVSSGAAKPPPLVNADEELAGFLDQAQGYIEKKAYGRAIEILQAMILRADAGFVASPDGRRFVPLWRKANELIGSMPPEGLKLYRQMYDSQARRLYEQAIESGDVAALRRVARRHMHTTVAPKALAKLAAIHFDRAEFAQAARYWREALKLPHGAAGKPLLLAKIAAASHLAGQASQAEEAVKTLEQSHPKATGVLGGRTENLLQFARRMREMPVPVAARPRAAGDWPGLGGIPDGMATMSECDVVLSPAWQVPKAALSGKIQPGDAVALRRLLQLPAMPLQLRGRIMLGPVPWGGRSSTIAVGQAAGLQLRGGLVFIAYQYGNQRRELPVPAAVHPVVADRMVIYRTDEAVIAYSLLSGGERRTGKPLWEAKLPLERSVTANVGTSNYRYLGLFLGDTGRHMITVGGGKVYALSDFLPGVGPYLLAARMARPGVRLPADTSSLVALSLKDQGARVWKLPNKQVKDEVVAGGKFVSAPTYSAGRLYVIAMHLENYYLLCLNAETGNLVWRASIAQVPALPQNYARYSLGHLAERCSPPAVADGRVFALTGAGAMAAFEADTGQALWAYQYDSDVNLLRPYRSGLPQQAAPSMPPNPMIVAGGRVLVLPADSKNVFALAVDDGKPVWAKPTGRAGQRHLSAIDRNRVLLSGPQLMVLSSATGKVIHNAAGVKDVHGRPAVAEKRVYASGLGKIYRLSLEGYELTSSELAETAGLLGNLVSVQGKLIAANVLGMSAYFNYDQVREEVAAKIASAVSEEKADMLFQLVRLSFNAQRFPQALKDIGQCRELAEQLEDSLLSRQLDTWEYRTDVALGNQEDSPDAMLDWFQKAQALAHTNQAKGHMLIRLAKCQEMQGDLSTAVALAQELAEQYGKEELADLPIGADADLSVRLGPDVQRFRGRHLGQRFIQRLIKIHGRDIYADFDRKAKAALAGAREAKKPEAMSAVAQRWPHSVWADDALLAAAEVYYQQAAAAEAKQAQGLMEKAVGHLREVAHMPDSPLWASANVALAVIYSRTGWPTVARICCDKVKGLPPETSIVFADVRGRLDAVLRRLEDGGVGPPIKVALSEAGSIRPPLRKVFQIEGVNAFVLRDQEFRPVRLASNVFVLRDDRLLMVDMSAGSLAAAVRWSGLTGVNTELLLRTGAYNPGYRLVGTLSADRKVVVVADRTAATGLDVANGKVVWQKKLADYGLPGGVCMAAGEGSLVLVHPTGKMVCADAATGKLLWRGNLVGGNRAPSGPPVIRQGLVLTVHNSYQGVTCFDLKTGKVLGKWQGKYGQGFVTPAGLVVTMIDGVLAVRDRGRLDQPLWSAKYDFNQGPAVLSVEGGGVVVVPSLVQGHVDVLSITGGRRLAHLKRASFGGLQPVPVDADFDGKNVYVTYSLTAHGRPKYYFARTSACRGMSVQKFDLSGKRLWQRDISTTPQSYYYCLPLVRGRQHVIVTARQTNFNMPSHVHVLTDALGREVEQIDVRGPAGDPKLVYRMTGLGPPILGLGRLCVETGQGVTVYGEH